VRTFLRKAVVLLLVTGVAVGVALAMIYRAAQHEPDFYQQALQGELTEQSVAGEQLEQNILQLHNNSRKQGRWEAVFTEQELNGWLASDLPDKFPNLLPKGVAEPRVAIDGEGVRIACRYENTKINAVISFQLGIQLTDESNTLAVRVSKVRAGALPVPLTRFLGRITAAAHRSDISLRWSQTEGDPVALVTVPHRHEDYAHREIYLESIELRDGCVYLAGRTEEHPRLPAAAVARNDSRLQDPNLTIQR
jgi:hypothetical protein